MIWKGFSDLIVTGSMVEGNISTSPFTDGKETVRLFRDFTGDSSPDIREMYGTRHLKDGEPLFKTNDVMNEVTFYPSFFKAIAIAGKRLLRIQGPTAWHE